MKIENINTIVHGIIDVLKYSPSMIMSWGANTFKVVIYKEMAALQFTVSGFVHKGVVIVAYNEGDDLYEVYCLGDKNEIINYQTAVYCDILAQTIDRMVEKNCSDEQYTAKSKKFIAEVLSR